MKTREEAGQLVAEEDIYATKEGKLVGPDDPEANELVAAAGQATRDESAQKCGLKPGGEKKAEPAEKKTIDAEHVIGEGEPSQTKRKIT